MKFQPTTAATHLLHGIYGIVSCHIELKIITIVIFNFFFYLLISPLLGSIKLAQHTTLFDRAQSLNEVSKNEIIKFNLSHIADEPEKSELGQVSVIVSSE